MQEVGTVCAMEFGKKTHFNQLQWTAWSSCRP